MRRTPVGPRSDPIGVSAEFAAIARFAVEDGSNRSLVGETEGDSLGSERVEI
jgi:hypothetical protein